MDIYRLEAVLDLPDLFAHVLDFRHRRLFLVRNIAGVVVCVVEG